MKISHGICCCLALAWLTSPAVADTLHLRNGDRLNGKVLEMTATEIKFESEIHGIFKLPRDKVVGVVIGTPPEEAKPQPKPARPRAGGAGAVPGSVDDILDRMLPKNFDQQSVQELGKAAGAPGGTADEVIEQLRTEGIDPALMSELNLRLPGFGSPAVQGYFNDRVNGLIDGSISIDDIRRDASQAADELRSLKADLGPSGAALDGYLGILEGFLNATAPPVAAPPAAAGKDAKPANPAAGRPSTRQAPGAAHPGKPANPAETAPPRFRGAGEKDAAEKEKP